MTSLPERFACMRWMPRHVSAATLMGALGARGSEMLTWLAPPCAQAGLRKPRHPAHPWGLLTFVFFFFILKTLDAIWMVDRVSA